MIIGALKEAEFEKRIPITPESIKKLSSFSFLLEHGFGTTCGYDDSLFNLPNVSFENKKSILEKSKIILSINCPDIESARIVRPGTIMVGQFSPLKNLDTIKQLARIGASVFSIELLPRITRAQFMDVLSSQSSLAGYQAIIKAASLLGRSFPMMITAAGNVPAAKVLIIGAGVAGLQAIATAKRLGAVVSAFDVRSTSKAEVESLGATFVEVNANEVGDGEGGYAKEMSEAYKKAQQEKLTEVISKQDVIITTAQIPNKPAPKIITKNMVEMMKNGSVILDLAAESGGNCELSVLGEEVNFNGKKIIAPKNIINEIANTASNLFSSNLVSFIKTLFKIDNNEISFDMNDQLIQSTLLTNNGAVIHPILK